MKKILLALSFIPSCVFVIQAQTTFDIGLKIDSNTYIYPEQITSQITSDGGAMIINTNPFYNMAPYGYGVEISKLNSNGNVTWQKRIIDTTNNAIVPVINASLNIRRIIELTDGSFIIAGESGTNSYSLNNKFLIKISSTGVLLWTRNFISSLYTLNEVKPTSDHGFIIASGQSVPNGTNTAALLLKVDSTGNRQWEKQVNFSTENDFFFSVTELSTGGFMACGLAIVNSISSKGVLVKTDNNGNIIWSKTIPGSALKYIDELPGGNLIIATDLGLLSEIDKDGNFLWSKKWSKQNNTAGTNNLNFYSFTKQKQIFLSGEFQDQLGKNTNVVLKIDTGGNLLWSKKYLTDSLFPVPIYTFNASAINSGCLLWTQYNVVKTDSLGAVSGSNCFFSDTVGVISAIQAPTIQIASPSVLDTVSVIKSTIFMVNNNTHLVTYNPCNSSTSTGVNETTVKNNHITIYPNPATNELNISAVNKIEKVEVYNLTGILESSSNKNKIDISDLSDGIYFVKVYSENGVAIQKFIKQ